MPKASDTEKLKALLHFKLNNDNLKIGITQTELNSMPQSVWNKFACFAMETAGEEARYSKAQKTAAICLWYRAVIDFNGHAKYFSEKEEAQKGEAERALRAIGASEFADNFADAVKYGHCDDYEKADRWFKENSEKLVEIITNYLRSNSAEFFEIVAEDYTMRQPKYIFWIGVIGAVFFFGLMALLLIYSTEDELPVFLGFAGFGSLGAALAVYAKLWSVAVKKEIIKVNLPFRKPKELCLDEITKVRQTLHGFIVYVDGKRAFGVDNVVNNLDMFGAQLRAAGKMEATQQKNDFTVKRYKVEVAVGLVCSLFFGAMLMWVIFRPNATVNAFVYIGFSAFFIAALFWTLYLLAWRLTVFEDTITVKTIFGSEREYSIKEITRADLAKEKLVIYAGNEKIAKVAYNCNSYPILIERLEREGIPFYHKGKIIERQI